MKFFTARNLVWKHLLITVFISAATEMSAQSKLTENPKPDFSKTKKLIKAQLEHNKIPSISIAVIKHGKILWEESFGIADKEHNIKANIHTSYYLASLSKSITATAIMRLSEENLINLNSPANKYLKNVKVSSFLWNVDSATIQRLLNHTSGLTTYHRDCYLNEPSCPQSIDSAVQRYGIIFWEPGNHFDYSNLGYGILGKVISDVSNKSFSNYLESELFTPLGMQNSFLGTSLNYKNIAARYNSDSARSRAPDVVSYTPGASSVYSSVDDLAKFAMLFLKDQVNGGKKIISNNSIDYMENSLVSSGEANRFHGLGWSIDTNYYGFKAVTGQGGTSDANAWLRMIPSEDVAVILLSNTGISGDICTNIINEAFSSVLPKFKRNLSSYQKTDTPVQSFLISDTLYGRWKGKIHTYKKDIDITISLSKEGNNFVTLENDNALKISNLEFNERLFFDVFGDLKVDDTETAPYKMGFELSQLDNKLYGAITANAKAQLPFWVELNKTAER